MSKHKKPPAHISFPVAPELVERLDAELEKLREQFPAWRIDRQALIKMLLAEALEHRQAPASK